MLLTILKYIFYAVSFLLVLIFSLRIIFDKNFKTNNKLSPIVASIGVLFILYIVFAIGIVIFMPNIFEKIIMLLFGVSPFIIGKIVTYKKLKFYSIIQILCVILSVAFLITL